MQIWLGHVSLISSVFLENVPALTILAEVFLIVAAHFICAKHCLQTDDDLYLTYQGVLDAVRMSDSLEKEENITKKLINSIIPDSLTTKIMDELMDEHKDMNMRKV